MTDDEIKQGIAICEKATKGPWDWNVNIESRSISLRSRSHDIVIDFARWGLNSARPRFNVDGLMQKADALSKIVPGREHHQTWYRALSHPDADLIAFFGTHGLALLRDLEKERARNEELVKENEQVAQFTGGCVARGGELLEAMRTVRAHTAFNPGAPYDLLVGLLGSIERIADKALLSPRLEDRKETT